MRNYASDEVQIAWTPPGFVLDLKEGVAAGTFITEAATAPRYTKKDTGTGKVVRVKNPTQSGTVSLVVDQESETHRQLKLAALADDLAQNIVGPLVLSDGNTGETVIYVNAFIENDPDETRGTESATFTWMFGFERKVVSVGQPHANVVGS